MINNINNYRGLNNKEVEKLQKQYGKNILLANKKNNFLYKIIHIILQPMFMLLIVAAITYFILGDGKDGIMMLVSVVGIIIIDVFQEFKTNKALEALRNLSMPKIRVIRNNKEQMINSEDLVPGDIMIISEGTKIPADGKVLEANTLFIDESMLTGESIPVLKSTIKDNDNFWRKDYCYAGTLVTRGFAVIEVENTGFKTEYGKIGKNILINVDKKTPLQKQINRLIKISGIGALILFFTNIIITYFDLSNLSLYDRITKSVLSGITLAMAIIPEEFPVILTVFLSLGAARLVKKNSLVKNLASVETLGAVSVLCVDKTGTITMNKMEVKEVYSFKKLDKDTYLTMAESCQVNSYDPIEKAIINYCINMGISSDKISKKQVIKEYAFTDEAKIMGHVIEKKNNSLLIVKGSSENIFKNAKLTKEEIIFYQQKVKEMSEKGLRVIAIAKKELSNEKEVLDDLKEYKLEISSIIGLMDPPRKNVKDNIKTCLQAGIQVVMITGDNGITASAIAKEIGIANSENIITGNEIDEMTDDELRLRVKDVGIFSRVVPEHKMRIVKAFKANKKVVAMTGDGVNDAPALKNSDIGIAMGNGSEVARETADLILLDDNFQTIEDTIEDGRRIYDNIKKTIEYIFIIHIPIVLSSLIGPLMGINIHDLLFLPIHIVLFEFIIDPTCSIVLERQPKEKDIMNRPPRNNKEKIIDYRGLANSILQGTVLFIGAFSSYLYFLDKDPLVARTVGFCIIILSNILLVQMNSSKTRTFIQNLTYFFKDRVMVIVSLIVVIGMMLIIYTKANSFFKLAALDFNQMLTVIIVSIVSVLWYEPIKLYKARKKSHS